MLNSVWGFLRNAANVCIESWQWCLRNGEAADCGYPQGLKTAATARPGITLRGPGLVHGNPSVAKWTKSTRPTNVPKAAPMDIRRG